MFCFWGFLEAAPRCLYECGATILRCRGLVVVESAWPWMDERRTARRGVQADLAVSRAQGRQRPASEGADRGQRSGGRKENICSLAVLF